jgi:hypothetical protein
METRRIEKRRLHEGIWVALALFLLIGLSNSSVFASVRDSLLKQSSAVITPPSVVLQNGTTGASIVYMNNTSAVVRVTSRGWNVQSGTGSISAGNTYTIVNINSVTLSKSFLLVEFGGGIAGTQPEQDVIVSGKFDSASQLRFDRTGTTNPANFGYYVIEALSTQISVQSGTTMFASAETLKDTNIDDVADTGKCVVFLSRRSTGTDRTQYYESFVTGELTNNTNVRLSRQGTGTTVTAEWFAVKFNDETTIQTGETAVSTSNPTSQNIGSVDLSRSWLYFTWRATANGLGQDSPRGWLQTSTQIQWSRQTTTGTVYGRWFVIQMPSGTNVQRGLSDSTVSSEYTKDVTISPVSLNRTFSFTTCDSTGTGNNFPRPFWIERITNTTDLRLQRWYTGQTSDHNWQVIELPDAYDYVLQVNNQVANLWKVRLRAYDQANIGRLSNCTIYFRDGAGVSLQIYVYGGAYSQQVGSWYDLTSLSTIYIAMTAIANTTGTSYLYAYLEVLIPNTSTGILMVATFEVS